MLHPIIDEICDDEYVNEMAALNVAEHVDALEAAKDNHEMETAVAKFNEKAAAGEDEDLGGGDIIPQQQKSKSKGKARASRSRVFQDADDDE